MEKVKVWHYRFGDYESMEVSPMSKEDFQKMPPKYIVTHKVKGISGTKDETYVLFKTPSTVPKSCSVSPGQYYGVLAKDYKEVLRSIPHIPNKKEAKELRKQKKKQGN